MNMTPEQLAFMQWQMQQAQQAQQKKEEEPKPTCKGIFCGTRKEYDKNGKVKIIKQMMRFK